MNQSIRLRAINALQQTGCVEQLITMVDFNSNLDRAAIVALLASDPTLSQLGVSEGRCDRSVRVLVNKKILEPNGRPPYPPGMLPANTKFSALAKAICE